jgi:hypothetical protein
VFKNSAGKTPVSDVLRQCERELAVAGLWKALWTQNRARTFRLTNCPVSERSCEGLKMEIPVEKSHA